VIGPTKYRTKHIYKLTLLELTCKTFKKCTRFYFGNDMFASKSNEVESRYLPEKVTSF